MLIRPSVSSSFSSSFVISSPLIAKKHVTPSPPFRTGSSHGNRTHSGELLCANTTASTASARSPSSDGIERPFDILLVPRPKTIHQLARLNVSPHRLACRQPLIRVPHISLLRCGPGPPTSTHLIGLLLRIHLRRTPPWRNVLRAVPIKTRHPNHHHPFRRRPVALHRHPSLQPSLRAQAPQSAHAR